MNKLFGRDYCNWQDYPIFRYWITKNPFISLIANLKPPGETGKYLNNDKIIKG